MRILPYIALLFLLPFRTDAQCPRLNDGQGNPSTNPYWVSCSGGNFTLFIQSPDNIGRYSLNYGDGSPVVSGSSLVPPAFLSHTYSATVDTFIVTLVDSSAGCTIKGVVVMEVTPSASIQIPSGNPLSGCTPATFTFRNGSTNVSKTTKFSWSFGDNTPLQYYDYTNLGKDVSHTYLPGTTNCNVAITLTAENYCNRGNPSVNTYQPIQVWDIDDASIGVDNAVRCFPDRRFHFTNSTNLNCYAQGNSTQRYEYWNFGNYWGKGHDSIVTWQPFNPPNRPGYFISYPGPGTYSLMLIDSSFCGKDTTVSSVQVVLPPVANFNPAQDTVCQGYSISFTNTSTGAGNFQWNFGDGTAPVNTGTNSSVLHTFNNSGTFSVQLIATSTGTGGCSDTINKNVFIKPAPVASFVMDNPSGCDSLKVAFTDFSQNAISWQWNFGGGNIFNGKNPPTQNYPQPGYYPVTLTVGAANGCFGTKTDSVKVYKSPQAYIRLASAICQGNSAQFSDSSQSLAGDPVNSWQWAFGDGGNSTIQNPSHVYLNSGNYVITLNVSTAHCPGKSGTMNITVNPLPVPGFNINPVSGCTPLNVSFSNTASGFTKVYWNFGDGSQDSSNAPIHLYQNNNINDTLYRIRQVVKNVFGCTDTMFSQVNVYALPKSKFISNASPGCSPVSVNFTNQSNNAASYSWDFGDGSPINTTVSPSHSFNNSSSFIQFYQVKLVATSSKGCTDTSSQSVIVYPSPSYSVTTNPASRSGCNPLNVDFQASSSGVNYHWDFGDGDSSLLQNPSHVFVNSNTTTKVFTVVLTATNAFLCTSTSTIDVTVYPIPKADFLAQPDSQTFPNSSVVLSNLSSGGNNYAWNFGDGNSSVLNNPGSHAYSTWGDYFISLKVLNAEGCRDSVTKRVRIMAPKPVAKFLISDSSGCEPLGISFVSLPSPTLYAKKATWEFGDGGTSNEDNPYYQYHESGNYTVRLIVSGDGGKDTSTAKIEVYKKPAPFFTVNPKVVYIPSDPLYCLNLSTFATKFKWEFGDGTRSFEKDPVHYYEKEGIYDISLMAENDHGCMDSVTISKIVRAEILSDIIFPNAFVPDANGPNGGYYERNSLENKVFFPITKGVSEYHLMIFNRWGEMIFETRDLNTGWDGYYKGQLCPQDVYIWKVELKMADGRSLSRAGDVTLLR